MTGVLSGPGVGTSFAIPQEDENGKVKIRRGEGWRRSSHNATVRAWDVPTHHTVGDFAAMTPGGRCGATSLATTSSTPTDSGRYAIA